MEKISNEAIADVYPDYYSHALEVDALSEKVAGHRNEKDVADDSLKNLENYAEDAKRVAEFCKKAISNVPRMIQWDKKHRRNVVFEQVGIALLIGVVLAVVGGFAYAYAEHLFDKTTDSKPVPTNSVPTQITK